MKTIVCYGDSNTWGFDPATQDRLPVTERWTGVLAQELGLSCYRTNSRSTTRVAQQYRRHFLDTAQIVVSSDLDEIHLEADQHRKLGLAVAARAREILQ
jgi:hypothetical protein